MAKFADFGYRATKFVVPGRSMTKTAELDDFDRALLREVQIDNQTPARVLAERVGLSQSAVLRRLRRLRAEKVISADVSIVRPDVLGVPVTIHVLVSIERGAQTAGEFSRRLQARPEVKHASYVTGDADFVLHLQMESMEAYAAFTREVFHGDPTVSEYHTYVSMREVVGPSSRAHPGKPKDKSRRHKQPSSP